MLHRLDLPRRPGRLAAAVTALACAVSAASAMPQATAGSLDYRLSYASTPGGANRVVRWNPCQTITYRINAAHAGSTAAARAAAVKDVRTAIGRLSSRTGIPFRYQGATSGIPRSTSTSPWWRRQTSAELVVAWVDQTRTSTRSGLLGRTSSGQWAAGTGGYAYKYWSAGGKWRLAAGRGFLVLDTRQRGKFRAGFGSGVTRGALLLHELGHVMGLRHVDARSQLMYPVVLSRRSAYYRGGDTSGLARVGRPAGCITVPSGVWPAL